MGPYNTSSEFSGGTKFSMTVQFQKLPNTGNSRSNGKCLGAHNSAKKNTA